MIILPGSGIRTKTLSLRWLHLWVVLGWSCLRSASITDVADWVEWASGSTYLEFKNLAADLVVSQAAVRTSATGLVCSSVL